MPCHPSSMTIILLLSYICTCTSKRHLSSKYCPTVCSIESILLCIAHAATTNKDTVTTDVVVKIHLHQIRFMTTIAIATTLHLASVDKELALEMPSFPDSSSSSSSKESDREEYVEEGRFSPSSSSSESGTDAVDDGDDDDDGDKYSSTPSLPDEALLLSLSLS